MSPARQRPPGSGSSRSRTHDVVRLRLQLAEVHPVVWRRLLVPGAPTLDRLHLIFQAAMGWENAHLHNFFMGDQVYGPADEDADMNGDMEEVDETEVTIIDAIGGQRRFTYDYDFGDGWHHEVVVEATSSSPLPMPFAVCIDGENACPPEDCGGPPGYDELVRILGDAAHPEHDLMAKRVGAFDPSAFDLATANAALQAIR